MLKKIYTLTQTTLGSSFLDELKIKSYSDTAPLNCNETTNRKCIIELTITHRQTDFLLCHESTIWCSHSVANNKGGHWKVDNKPR